MIITLFFRHSALIDNHNQARQFLLALEKAWVVQCGFFWLSTTVLGMEVTNAWKAAKLLKPIKYGDMDVKEFTQRVWPERCWSMQASSSARRSSLPAMHRRCERLVVARAWWLMR